MRDVTVESRRHLTHQSRPLLNLAGGGALWFMFSLTQTFSGVQYGPFASGTVLGRASLPVVSKRVSREQVRVVLLAGGVVSVETVGLNPCGICGKGAVQLVWRGRGAGRLAPADCVLRLVANDPCTEFKLECTGIAESTQAPQPAHAANADGEELATSNPTSPHRPPPAKRARHGSDTAAARVRSCERGTDCVDLTREHNLACAHPGAEDWQAQCVHPARLVPRELPSMSATMRYQTLGDGAVVYGAPVAVHHTPAPLAVAAFDLDDTLMVRSHGQQKFIATGYPQELRAVRSHAAAVAQQRLTAFVLQVFPTTASVISNLWCSGYTIAVFTNQANSSPQMVQSHVERLRELLGGRVPFFAFAAVQYGRFRKPNAGMWAEFLRLVGGGPVDLSRSFFVGDAAGRPADFSVCDRQFAANCG